MVALGLAVVAWGKWITGDHFRPTPHGTDEFGGSSLLLLHVLEGIFAAVAIAFIWFCLLRPLLRERRLTFDGMLVITAVTLWYLDPLDNYVNFTFTYNTHLLNLGSWTEFIPGVRYPNIERFPEPIVALPSLYVIWVCVSAVGGCAFLNWVRSRWPAISTGKLISVLFVTFAAIDLGGEIFLIRTNVFAYPGTVKGFTLWSGSRYQFPLHEPLCVAVWCTGMTLLRYYRNDRGQSIAERGVEKLRLPAKARTGLSLLAVIGYMHALFVVGYFFPYNAMAVQADTWPAMPSYMRAGMCGDGTDTACPSEYVPIPSRNSLKIGPDDPRLPNWVRERQGLR